jgi:NADPH:quinone reductase
MIAPRISGTYPLEQAGEAIRAVAERRVVGKLVVTLD